MGVLTDHACTRVGSTNETELVLMARPSPRRYPWVCCARPSPVAASPA
jgi:hypothetical protein